LIESYEFGRIEVDGNIYTSDVIIFTDKVYQGWRRKEGHNLSIDDIEPVIRERPDVLVLGTGVNGLMRIPDKTRHYIASVGIKLIAERTGKACEIYNEVSRSEKAIAALHLTC